MRIKIFVPLLFAIIISCKEKQLEPLPPKIVKIEPLPFLPFAKAELIDLENFRDVTANWKITGNAFLDTSQEKIVTSKEGSGILVNNPTEEMKGNLFTAFEHGDIELEVDVMMPKGSNSGLYFQGRYEVQLLDSWGVIDPQHGDMGGIYQRWDDRRRIGKEGFEGVAPKINAAKAPGLWQHFKIIFHAPKFDTDGNKIKNAEFEKVWLNGVLIHENVSLSGPTRAAAFEDEKPKGPIMFQGDHGAVALKNIKYKTYDNKKVSFSEITMTEYENKEVLLPNLDSLTPLREIKADSISAMMVSGERAQSILKFNGKMNVPETGDYLFDLKVNNGGGILLVDKDTVIDLNGDYNLDSLGIGKRSLQKGMVPFTLIYNKHIPWRIGFSLEVEGPGIQKHALQANHSLDLSQGVPDENIMVEVENEPLTQRSFLMHDGEKRTHCISVGTVQKIHYAYDLNFGSLLKVWSGDFLDATPMWHGRGEKQLGVPAGFTISFHGNPEFAMLENDDSIWPEAISEDSKRKPLGYEFDEIGNPVFSSQIGSNIIKDKMIPSKTLRMLHRSIEVDGDQEIWHKIAAGESIEKLPDGTYIVNDESFFIDFSENSKLSPILRNSNEADELLVKIPAGQQLVEYSIIW